MNQQNFGLTGTRSQHEHFEEEFDTFLDGLFNNPERKAHRAEKKELRLDKKRADINRKNAEAQAMLSIAGGNETSQGEQSESSNTMTYAIAGGLLLVLVIGAVVMASKSKNGAAVEYDETQAAEMATGIGETVA